MKGRANAGRRAVPGPGTFELCRDHTRVIEHQRIARRQQVWQIADTMIGKRRISVRPDHQHPRSITRTDRPEGNPFVRQLEIELVDAHGNQSA